MHKTSFRPMVLAFAASLALVACGGDDDHAVGMADGASQVPASATVSITAFSAYVAGLAADDSAEPLLLTGLVPPVSDTEEPIAVR
jgi:ABC-type glycerol-3-phosphate transport system substrate-binding protein